MSKVAGKMRVMKKAVDKVNHTSKMRTNIPAGKSFPILSKTTETDLDTAF